jgi:hypothetical protein
MSRTARFWSWFQANEQRYRDLDVPDKEQLLDELQTQLQAFDEDLWFEVGGSPTGPRELVISAEGKLAAFPALRELCRAAPLIPGWTVVSFKQPQGFEFTTKYEDIVVSPEATWFVPMVSSQNPQLLGLRLAFAHFVAHQERQFLSAAYTMLEAGLGEFAAAEYIAHVEVCLAPSSPEAEGYRTLQELPDYLAQRNGALTPNTSFERTREG